jgi:putative heme-binding domain-containing protein
MPRAWPDVAKALANDAESRVHVTNLSAIFGDATAMAALRATLADARADLGARREALSTLLRARDAGLSQTLVELLGDPALRGQALRGLAAFDDTAIPTAIVRGYPQYSPGEKRDALNTLVTRPVFALALLDAVEAKRIAASDLTADLIRNLRNLKHEKLEERLRAVWGTVRDTPAERAGLIDKYTSIIRRGYSDAPDPMLGRAIFAKTCQQCHVLFGVGAKTGPDLTGSNRADLEYILTNLVDPSALVGKDYQAHVIATEDGRVLTGIVQREDPNTLTLVTANETLTLPKGDVSERKLTPDSLMPEDQLKDLSDHEIRSLVAYLTGPAQAPLLATRENAATFWNGKDLTGWIGDASLWSVEDGEIVGKAPRGLLRNEFLRSEMAAGDFTLSLEVKLVKNEGNSGIQFRSEPHGDGEMKGYQADIGAGWWGKLYEENGRALLWDKSGEPFVKLGEWNTYKIICKDSRIRTEINGKTCVDLDDPPGARRGVFALQLHSGGPTEVRFRNMCLEIPERATVATIKKP